jgi:hypothetical protein
MRSMVEGPFRPMNPSTALRAVPLPEKSRGGFRECVDYPSATLHSAVAAGCQAGVRAGERGRPRGPKPPKEQPPRNLSGTRDRARKGTLESGPPGGPTEGVSGT